MLPIIDFKVNGTDDIVISSDNYLSETDTMMSAFRCGERRCQARYDDFTLTPEICLGIETMIQKYINKFTISEIEQKVRVSLQYHQLFLEKDFKIYIYQDEYDGSKLKVLISIAPGSSDENSEYTFSVTVNIENQRSFR